MTARVFFIFLVAAGVSTTACTTQQHLAREQQSAIATLSETNAFLVRENKVLVDSIAYFDYLDSGQYDRDLRALMQDVDRLSFELEACSSGGRTLAVELVDDLFEPASSRLSAGGLRALEALDEQLQGEGPGYLRIEGHADSSKPAGSLRDRYPTNWELTAARAARVARLLIDSGGADPERVEVVSYGDTRPVASNDTRAGRRANRRIRVSFRPVSDPPDPDEPAASEDVR